jgi:hypothetical protein
VSIARRPEEFGGNEPILVISATPPPAVIIGEPPHEPLGIGIQAIQPSPCHAGLAGPSPTRLRRCTRFNGMLVSRRSFPLG